MVKLREGYDHVVVSRYLAHAISHDDHLITAFGNWMFSRLMRPLAKFPVTDALNIYRGYRRDILLDPDLEFYLKGPVLEPLITGMCALRGLRAGEIPGDEPQRIEIVVSAPSHSLPRMRGRVRVGAPRQVLNYLGEEARV